jgi:septal ring factor EnvC (AmiA/AmiB activator)
MCASAVLSVHKLSVPVHAVFFLRQVAYHCVENGRSLEVLQERYAELANALFTAVSNLSQQYMALSTAAEATAAALATSRSSAEHMQQCLTAQQAAAQEAQQELACLAAKHVQLEQDSQVTIQQLQQLAVGLKQQLWEARSAAEQQAADAQAAAAQEAEVADRRLAAAEDEIDDLKQRLTFVHAQLQAVQ